MAEGRSFPVTKMLFLILPNTENSIFKIFNNLENITAFNC